MKLVLERLYSYVKKSPRLKKIVKPIWGIIPKLKTLPHRLLHPASPPPNKVIRHTFDWWEVEKQKPHTKAKYQVVIEPQSMERTPPITLEEDQGFLKKLNYHSEYRESFVVTIPNGRAFTEGNIITSDNELLLDLSGTMLDRIDEYIIETEDGPILTDKLKSLPPPKKLKGKAVVLAIHSGAGYYHWIMEVIPRIHLLEKAGISLDEVDHIIIISKVTNFIDEIMGMLNIPKEKVIESHWHPHIQADELIVPSLIGYFFEIPIWPCQYLHQAFADHIYPQKADKKIYISRGNCGHRRVVNEKQLESHLESLGFDIVLLETMNMPEKIKTLSEASFIVAPHGAGLANMVFCHPGVTVVELTHHSTFAMAGWNIGLNMGMEYFVVRSIPEDAPATLLKIEQLEDLERQALDITIDIDKLDRALQLAQQATPATTDI